MADADGHNSDPDEEILNSFFEVDPTPTGADKEVVENKLALELAKYQRALEEEWEAEKKWEEGKLSPTAIRDKTKELLTQAVPKSVAALLYLSQHAKNEQVRLKAATYIVDKAIGHETGLVGDPLEELLNSVKS